MKKPGFWNASTREKLETLWLAFVVAIVIATGVFIGAMAAFLVVR